MTTLEDKALWIARKAYQANWKEHKYIDTVQFGNSVNTTAQTFLLNGLTLGDTAITRNGQKIIIDKILIRLKLKLNEESETTTIRIILFIDNQANATVVDDPLETPTNILSPLSIEYGNRFTILFDKIIPMSKQFNPILIIDKTFTTNIVTTYNGATIGTIADIQTGALYFYIVSTQAAIDSDTYVLEARVRFRDG